MEQIYEIVTITTQAGARQVFEVVASDRWPGLRAYVKDSTQYYEMGVFERGLGSGRAARVERHLTVGTDIFTYDALLQQSR